MRPAADGVLEVLGRNECLELLATRSVGRLAVARGREAPLVVPVNYVVDEEAILFRTGYGTKLRAVAASPVSFQVDWVDLLSGVGWSVLISGRGQEIRARDARSPLPEPWVSDDKPYLVRLSIGRITGRRIVRSAQP